MFFCILTSLHYRINLSLSSWINVLWFTVVFNYTSFFPVESILISFYHTGPNYKLSLLTLAETCTGWQVRVSKKPYNLQWTTACNITLQPRLAVAKVFLYNKLYLSDTVVGVAVKDETVTKFCYAYMFMQTYIWGIWGRILVYLCIFTFKQAD